MLCKHAGSDLCRYSRYPRKDIRRLLRGRGSQRDQAEHRPGVPDGNSSATVPQLAPGGSQQFTFYDGPVPQSIKGVRVLVTDQSGMNTGDWKLLG